MIPADAARLLRALADRVRRNVPLNNDPERFHIEKSEIARKMAELADAMVVSAKPTERSETAAVKRPAPGRRQVIVSTVAVGGRLVAVQRRRAPFAISVE